MTWWLTVLVAAAVMNGFYWWGCHRGLKRGEALALKSINRFGQAQRAPRG